jgi:hypothetical protein
MNQNAFHPYLFATHPCTGRGSRKDDGLMPGVCVYADVQHFHPISLRKTRPNGCDTKLRFVSVAGMTEIIDVASAAPCVRDKAVYALPGVLSRSCWELPGRALFHAPSVIRRYPVQAKKHMTLVKTRWMGLRGGSSTPHHGVCLSQYAELRVIMSIQSSVYAPTARCTC